MIYFDNCATTKISREVLDAMMPYFDNYYGNASQPYSIGKESRKAIENAREIIAKSINAFPDEIIFTSCGSESNNCVIKSTKGNIISSKIEHHSILNALKNCNRKYVLLDTDKYGVVDEIKGNIIDNLGLVSIMLINNEIGTIEPIEKFSKYAHEHNAYFHTDAVQAVGHVDIDVRKLGIDFLSASAHKFHGPKGIGFLYCKKGIDLVPLIDGGAQEFNKRAGTENVAYIVGMAKALELAVNNIDKRNTILQKLEKEFINKINNTNLDFVINGSDNHNKGVISISFKDISAEMILHRLDLKGICVSAGSACDSKNTNLSHVIEAIRVPKEYAFGTIRISFDDSNTVNEIDILINELENILQRKK